MGRGLCIARALVTGLALLLPASARAEWYVGADVSAVVPVDEAETNVGWMAGLHGGYFFDLKVLKLGPELGADYGVFTPAATARKALGSGYAGVRATFDVVPVLVPYAYIHTGFGVADAKNLPDPNARERFATGAFLDFTAGVGYRIAPHLLLGLELGYATVEPGKCFCARWGHGGVSGNFTF